MRAEYNRDRLHQPLDMATPESKFRPSAEAAEALVPSAATREALNKTGHWLDV